MGLLLSTMITIYTVDNSLQVSPFVQDIPQVLLMAYMVDSSFYYTCCQGK